MNTQLIIQSLSLKVSLGVYEWEKAIKQTVLVDLYLSVDIQAAALSDDITATIDYTQLVVLLQTVADQRHYNLVESLSIEFKKNLVENFPQIRQGKLILHKPTAIVNSKDVAIEVCW